MTTRQRKTLAYCIAMIAAGLALVLTAHSNLDKNLIFGIGCVLIAGGWLLSKTVP